MVSVSSTTQDGAYSQDQWGRTSPPPTPFPPEIIEAILQHLELPSTSAASITLHPLQFLAAHLVSLPSTLLSPFAEITTPRARTSIPAIKSRRVLYASSQPPPHELSAEEGRLRWPLLWERMGGARKAPEITLAQKEEEDWVKDGFMRGTAGVNHVKKLGALLRENQEIREWEEARESRRVERRLDEVGEEFEEESDEEEEEDGGGAAAARAGQPVVREDQEGVKTAFERRLLEMFIDGLDRVDYTKIDLMEPEGGDPIAQRDAEDRYFDDEEPSQTPNGHVEGSGTEENELSTRLAKTENRVRQSLEATQGMSSQNGQGEYDY